MANLIRMPINNNNKEDPADEENRQDFNQLQQQLSRSPSQQLSSSTLSTSSSTSSAEIWPLQLNRPQLVDHYIFGETIGTGSYADVRECIDTRTLERCAVKVVNKQYLRRQNPSALQNQKMEIRLLRRLQHPNIIAMRECLFKGPKIYIILEHCTFVLSDLMNEQQDNKLCTSIARTLFHQLITGINYLHSVGVIHRDIKPQNLLITTCGTLKIIDFGVSQLLSIWNQQDLCTNYEGSPLYQAPEVISGQTQYHGYKVDVWSAGITLYQMLFGQYPFMDESLLGLYDKILAQDLEFPPTTCLIVEDLLSQMLDKNSKQRATTEMILNHPWLKYQDQTHDEYDPHSELIEFTHQWLHSNDVRDIYKSMSVLPYLHNYHFPHLVTMKVKRESVSSSPELPGSSTGSRASTPTLSSSNSTTTATATTGESNETSGVNNPHEMIADDQPVEWGTEGQYNLLKVPLIRANRFTTTQSELNRRRRRSQSRLRCRTFRPPSSR